MSNSVNLSSKLAVVSILILYNDMQGLQNVPIIQWLQAFLQRTIGPCDL